MAAESPPISPETTLRAILVVSSTIVGPTSRAISWRTRSAGRPACTRAWTTSLSFQLPSSHSIECNEIPNAILTIFANTISWNQMVAFNFAAGSEDSNIYLFDMRTSHEVSIFLKAKFPPWWTSILAQLASTWSLQVMTEISGYGSEGRLTAAIFTILRESCASFAQLTLLGRSTSFLVVTMGMFGCARKCFRMVGNQVCMRAADAGV